MNRNRNPTPQATVATSIDRPQELFSSRASVESPVVPRRELRGRLVALDATRGLAVIGMYLQHFGSNPTLTSIVSGNTTLLFVLCGGISYSLMARGLMEQGADPTPFRARMLARAVFVDVLGYALIMLHTPFGVILPAYAALFVLALLLVRRSGRVLAWATGALLLLSPPVMLFGFSAFSGARLLGDLAGGPLSAIALAPAFVAGMAIGRIDLMKTRVALLLAGAGAIMYAIGKGLAVSILPRLSHSFEMWLAGVARAGSGGPSPHAVWPLNIDSPPWHMLLWTAPHSASTFQTLMGLGLSFLVLGLACLVAKKAVAVLSPFAAVGRVALTMYAAQFVVVWLLQLAGAGDTRRIPFGDLFIVIVALLSGWLIARRPNGPLEALMRRFDRAFSASHRMSQ